MIKQLGTLKAPLLIFGGPYSNLHATKALLAEAKQRGIPKDNIICTGDITAYCGNPNETSELIKNAGIHSIQGNCEESLAADTENCGCGYDGETACALLSKTWYEFSKTHTPSSLKQWMGSLPFRLELTLGGKRVHVLHGSADSINTFIYPSTSRSLKEDEIRKTGADIIIAGHSGIPFTELINGKIWHNAGVIGLPANDGTPRTWYSIIQEKEGHLHFEHHALTYDHPAAAKSMRQHGLDEYATTLGTGIYPTFDSLADIEKDQTGIPLKPEVLKMKCDELLI